MFVIRSPLTPIASAVALRALATGVAVALGFFAVSDDDFARVVIAQSFAEAPRWDPSGTSWLPLPFWLNGALMALFGPHFWVARGFAIACSLASVAAVYQASLWFGLDRRSAWLAALVSSVLPHAVWLGYATVPEGLAAALCLLGVASTAQPELRLRWLGAGCLAAATLCRYETWAVALAVAALNLKDAVALRQSALVGPLALCVVGPLAWMGHGWLHHGDPTFFLDRVASYRRALGQGSGGEFRSLLNTPSLLLRCEPELAAAALLGLLPRVRRALPDLRRLGIGIGALLILLVLGDLGDGAPTHHPERALLFAWLGGCVLVGAALPLAFRYHRAGGLAVLGAVLVLALARPWTLPEHGFVDRREELRFGESIRDRVPRGERIVVDVGDYGYCAVIAGLARPSDAHGLSASDPRQRDTEDVPPSERLRGHLREQDAAWLVLKQPVSPDVASWTRTIQQSERLVLLEIESAPRR